MPMLRMAMDGKGVQTYGAPTADGRYSMKMPSWAPKSIWATSAASWISMSLEREDQVGKQSEPERPPRGGERRRTRPQKNGHSVAEESLPQYRDITSWNFSRDFPLLPRGIYWIL